MTRVLRGSRFDFRFFHTRAQPGRLRFHFRFEFRAVHHAFDVFLNAVESSQRIGRGERRYRVVLGGGHCESMMRRGVGGAESGGYRSYGSNQSGQK